MKYILIVSLFFGVLFAKSSDACYSVQLTSFYLKKNSSYNFKNKNYPSSCILVNTNGLRSVRCGCFEEYRDAENKLDRLLNRYDDAIIVNTYKRRFSKVTSNSFSQKSSHRQSSRSERKLSRDIDETDFDNYAQERMKESDYPSAEKYEQKKNIVKRRAYKSENDYAQESYDKSFYEEEEPKHKRNFYGQDEEEDDLYESEESETKQNYSHDTASANYGSYRSSSRRDYSRSSNKW